MAYRDHTKVIRIGDRMIGGGNPILIQYEAGGCGADGGSDSGVGAGGM